jgi:cyanophycinase
LWRLLAGSLVGLLLGLWPGALEAEPKIDMAPPRPAERETPGALVIAGGGLLPAIIRQRFVELAGGSKGRLVVIPTASARADQGGTSHGYDHWKALGLASVSVLHTRDPRKANDPAFVRPLREATAVWLEGGDQARLANAYHGTAVERELRRLLARGGVIGGTSAGAAVMSTVMITGGNPQARVGTGFGLLPDVVIDQHFQNRKRQQRLLGVLAQYRDCLGVGIDEQTALVVSGHTFTVVGNGTVQVCLPPSGAEPARVAKVLKPGASGDLLLLGRSLMSRLHPPAKSNPVVKPDRAVTP